MFYAYWRCARSIARHMHTRSVCTYSCNLVLSGPILESKGMCATFQKKCKRAKNCLKKGKIFESLGKNVQIWKFLKKGRWVKTLLEKTLVVHLELHFLIGRLSQGCRATAKRQFTFNHYVPSSSSWYSFDQNQMDEWLSLTWSHPMVLNPGPLNW